MPEPRWNLNAAAIGGLVLAVIGVVNHVSGKTDKTETAELKKEVVQLDKGQALSAKDIANIAKGIDELKELMLQVNRNQTIVLQKVMETHGNSYGPPAPDPNPLNR